MDTDQFLRLLSRPESDTLDFKAAAYDLSTANGRNSFTKDVLALANTPREVLARIILGVTWTPERGAVVTGLDSQLDDTVFQDAISDGRVTPRPKFRVVPFQYEGKQVGIVEIEPERTGPYTPIKDYPGTPELIGGAVYYRSGSQNRRAIGRHLHTILQWFVGSRGSAEHSRRLSPWTTFMSATHGFEPGRNYLLVADRITDDSGSVARLGLLPWRAAIDFDPDSDISGLLASARSTLDAHRVVHLVAPGDTAVQPDPGIHWYFARGLTGRQNVMVTDNHSAWLKQYKRDLAKQLDQLQVALSPNPLTVVVLWSQRSLRQHLRTLLEEVLAAFGDLAELIVVSDDAPGISAVCDETDVPFIEMSIGSLCSGIPGILSDPAEPPLDASALPMATGATVALDGGVALWLAEELEPLYLGIGTDGDESPDAFRRGATVTWRNLQLHHDCVRDLTAEARTQVESDLGRRQTTRINVYHAPGAGGTTVGRRVAWDLHQRYPTAVLHKCNPHATVDRIARIASLTDNSVLLLVDGGEVPERDIDSLFELSKAQQLSLVIVQVLRRFRRQTPGQRLFWLDDRLTNREADRFRHAYSTAVPAKAAALSSLAGSSEHAHRNPFFFGLTAFEREFLGLAKYVVTRIRGLTEIQQEILIYVALAHYYGQQAVPIQLFAPQLGIPRNRIVHLEYAFDKEAAAALDLTVPQDEKSVRASHQLVALEILRQLLSPKDAPDLWKQQLSERAKSFASFCRGTDHSPPERSVELIKRVFVFRDNIELLGTERSSQQQFAELIGDIPSMSGRVDVLRHVTEEFHEEAHFHAHLGRLLGMAGDFGPALQEVNLAISLQPEDSVLHHVRGMVLRYQMRHAMSTKGDMSEIVEQARQAQSSFERSRELSNDLEHGYISEIQMLLSLLDHSGQRARVPLQRHIERADVDPFVRTALERSEELLDRVQNLYVGEPLSPYALECRARLERLYEDYPRALQAWDALLARREVVKPPVRRQIVWTMLRRCGGNWKDITSSEADRMQRLLADNLEEDVKDSASLRLWLRAIRRGDRPPTLESVLEKVGYWQANTGSLDAAYYLYVLHGLRALEGSQQALADCERALEACRTIARYRRDRTRSFEWIGEGRGISRLVHQSTLGDWGDDFWESARELARLQGRVVSIDAPHKGYIEVEGGLEAFFVPVKGDFHREHDENARVSLFLGFSYDGPRAWSVTPYPVRS